MNTELNKLIAELAFLQNKISETQLKIDSVNDGFHYRIEFHRYGRHFERIFTNEYSAKNAALRCYCADNEGYATLYTNNPDLLNDEEFDWGDVSLEYEE